MFFRIYRVVRVYYYLKEISFNVKKKVIFLLLLFGLLDLLGRLDKSSRGLLFCG